MRDVRLQFSKKGLIRFVSHLDLYRAVMRALRRTDIPFWYTEGFNPHPYVTFALPLPLGAESENDIMDIRIIDSIKNTEITEKFNQMLPPGLTITDCYTPYDKYKDIVAADYRFFFEPETKKEAVSAIMASGELLCTKKGKAKGKKQSKPEITVNLLEGNPNFLLTETDEGLEMQIRLSAGNEKNINPILFASALEKANEAISCRLVRRVGFYTENGIFR